MDKSLIQIFRGDDTDGLGYQSIQGKITTTLDLTGCRAVFRYLGFTQEFDPIPENGRITITMPASATSKFPPGLGYASLRVYDSENKVRTFTNRIPVFVTVYAPSECGGEFEVVFNGGNLELEPLKIKSVNGYRIYDGYLEQIIDKATAIEYGLALLFDSGDGAKDANSGYAATPKAVQAAYDAIIGELTDNYYNAEETEEAIDRIAAYYITADAQGNPFETYAALMNATVFYSGGQQRTPTRNDYCVVLADETHGGKQYRYIYTVNQQGVGQWEAQYVVGGSIELDNTVTRTSTNGVKSSGIWSAIWGALTAVPGFSSLYDWCVAQLAGKASTADATLTPIEFTEWTLTADLQEMHFDFYGYTDGQWYFVSDNPELPFNVTFEGSEKAVYLEVVYNDQTWRASRKALGYILGSEDQSNPNYNKPLQPKGDYALRSELPSVPVQSVNGKTGAVQLAASDVDAVGNSGNQTLNGNLRISGSLVLFSANSYVAADKFYGSYICNQGDGQYEIPYGKTGTLALTSDIPSVAGLAPLASPAFTGTPTAPTPTEQSADTQIATKKYVDDAVAGGGGGNLDYVMRVDPETGGIYYTTPDTNA